MSCTFCRSSNQTEFPSEVNIHLPGLKNAAQPGVFVFPRLLVCLDCGSSSFMTPASQLAKLFHADELMARQDGVDSQQQIAASV